MEEEVIIQQVDQLEQVGTKRCRLNLNLVLNETDKAKTKASDKRGDSLEAKSFELEIYQS